MLACTVAASLSSFDWMASNFFSVSVALDFTGLLPCKSFYAAADVKRDL